MQMDSKICRVCLDKAATISLFENQDGFQHREKIMKCVNVRIEEGDGLPDAICEGCVNELVITYEFTQKCEASDKALRCLGLLQTTPDIPIELPIEPFKKEDDIKIETVPDFLLDDHYDTLVDQSYAEAYKNESYDEKEEKVVKKYKKKKPIPDYLRKQKPRVKTGPIQCVECGRVLPCHSAYETHLRKHTKERPFGCDLCHKYFRDKYTLKQHIKKHYGINLQEEKRLNPMKETDGRRKRIKMTPILCVICGIKVSSRSAMQQHMRSHTGEKPYQCELCDRSFALKGSLKRHRVSHSAKENPALCKYVCEHCGKKFHAKNSIIVHLRVHTGDKPYSCPYCPSRFCQISSLIRHKRRHTGDKPYSCLTCGKPFANKSEVQKHQLVHTDVKNFHCNICNKFFKSKNSLKVHIDVTHVKTKQCVCNYCGMAFTMKGNLTLHIRRKHSERSGFCTVCNKTYSDIDIHLRVHNGEKPYICKICEQAYTTKSGLSYHMNFKHRDSAKFKCTTGNCDKSFPKISMLEYHVLKAHLDSTPYICHHCKRGFLRPSDLSRHLKYNHLDTHTQVKSQFIKTIKLND